jgi:mono/diheme cytochrome c family protein
MTRAWGAGLAVVLVAAFASGVGLTANAQAGSGRVDRASAQSRQREQPKDDHPRLPPGDGRDVMIRVCSQCHGPDSAADQHLSLEGWQELVNQMVATGAEATPQEFDRIVQYLAKAFPAK